MSSIGSYTISPFINNRSVLSACGQGCVDSLEQFQVANFTSGATGTIGLSIQATLTPPLITANPIDIKTMQLWVDNLRTENCDFSITTPNLTLEATTGELSLTSETLIDINNGGSVGSTINIETDVDLTLSSNTGSIILDSNTALNGTLTLDNLGGTSNILTSSSAIIADTSSNLKNTSITPYQIEVRDEINGPLGDPVIIQISPGQIYMENQNNTQETLTLSVPVINMTNTNTGFINDIGPNNITIQDTGGNNVGSFSNLAVSISDTVSGLSTAMDSGSITSTNWAIDATGLGIFDTLTVNSIALVTTLSLTGTTLNIPLGGHAIDKSWAITINANVTVLNPSAGINGGVYKLWLTVGASPRTFSKACGVINNLLGDTVMAAFYLVD